MKVGILGSGSVSEVLASGFLNLGYQVMRGSRDPEKLADRQKSSGARPLTGTFAQAADFSDLLVIAVKGSAAEEVVKSCGAERLKNKIIIDTCNPIGDKPPVNGVLNFFTDINLSLMERLQKLAPGAHWVKAFSCVGSAHMYKPKFKDGQPTMFICGNDAGAKGKVSEILQAFGWDVADMGAAESARAIEPLCMLWCIPGFAKNDWNHSFNCCAVRDPYRCT